MSGLIALRNGDLIAVRLLVAFVVAWTEYVLREGGAAAVAWGRETGIGVLVRDGPVAFGPRRRSFRVRLRDARAVRYVHVSVTQLAGSSRTVSARIS